MKKITLLLCLFITAQVFSQGKSYVINGVMKKAPDNSYLYLTHKENDIAITDSALVKGEKFTFKGKIAEPNMYWITLRKAETPSLIFFVDNTAITITSEIDSLATAHIKGGPTQDDYKAWLKLQNNYAETRVGLIKQYNAYGQAQDQANAKRIMDTAIILERAYEKNIVKFIKDHPKSVIGGYAIWAVTFDWPKIEEYDEMYNALSEPVKKGKFGMLADDKIASIKGITIGYKAINFTQPDVDGKNVSLSSYKGKVVLVDFWASWCGPCRGENPAVVAAYQRYKEKGFDVLGVSLDQNKDKWVQAIAKDGLTWTHVSDLKGWQNEVAKKYGVTSIPFNVLVDKDGKVLAKGLRGQALEAKLAEIFDK
ncbi:MAG TPA: TlpA disulfide reductase family protein [Bacteroidia bacterium]|nr:TlpA disulfide reductase family protein [Bacteroidia bacterium]